MIWIITKLKYHGVDGTSLVGLREGEPLALRIFYYLLDYYYYSMYYYYQQQKTLPLLLLIIAIELGLVTKIFVIVTKNFVIVTKCFCYSFHKYTQ